MLDSEEDPPSAQLLTRPNVWPMEKKNHPIKTSTQWILDFPTKNELIENKIIHLMGFILI